MANYKVAYRPSAPITCTLTSLASSPTLTSGRSSANVDNTAPLDFDKMLTGTIVGGSSPTAGTRIEVWIIPQQTDSTYFDQFDGTDKDVTVGSRDALLSVGILLASITVSTTASNVVLGFSRSVAAAVGGALPARFQLFVTQNTGVALNSAGHLLTEKGSYTTSS